MPEQKRETMLGRSRRSLESSIFTERECVSWKQKTSGTIQWSESTIGKMRLSTAQDIRKFNPQKTFEPALPVV